MSGFSLATFLIAVLIGTMGLSSGVQRVHASGTIYIRADGSVDPLTAPISTMDNITYVIKGNISDSIVVERDNIICDGQGYTVQGTNAPDSKGMDLTGRSNVTIMYVNIEAFAIGIWLNHSSNNSLTGNNITANFYRGIYLVSSSSNSLNETNVTDNGYGIEFDSSSDNRVSQNRIVANKGTGIFLMSCLNNDLVGNIITGNDGDGIALGSCSNTNINGNSIRDNSDGIYFEHSSSNSIKGNTVANNTHGIALSYSSNNTVSENTIANSSGRGVSLDYAVSNSIYHNNFLHNSEQVGFVQLHFNNSWDDGYPSGGNYWSDYDGTDANHDGIGDAPYVIDANNTDHYPLMTQHIIPEFPTFIILPIFFIATTLAIIVSKREYA